MKIKIISFTDRGRGLAEKILSFYESPGARYAGNYTVSAYCCMKGFKSREGSRVMPWNGTVGEWAGKAFSDSRLIIFIGALGIAVRAAAPFIGHKYSDPAVLCVDENGRFVISVLSGHAGGANTEAARLSEHLGACPVITTATDGRGLFSPDTFAAENGLCITDPAAAKDISSLLLKGENVLFTSEFPVEGECPKGLIYPDREGNADDHAGDESSECAGRIHVGIRAMDSDIMDAVNAVNDDAMDDVDAVDDKSLRERMFLALVPRIVTLGIGCRRGTDPFELERSVRSLLSKHHLLPEAVEGICSIDLKKDEPALIKLAASLGVPFRTYTAEELKKQEGLFCSSSFVEAVTGVDNVCERSAAMGGNKTLLIPKTVCGKMTLAAFVSEWRGRFG